MVSRLVEGDQLRALLPDVWAGAEWPESYLHREVWLEMFADASYLSDDSSYPIPQQLIIFRGAAPQRRLGMSWTLDPDQAEWFARRFHIRSASVYQATAPPEAVLAVITTVRPGEAEVVVDPTLLQGIAARRRLK